MARAKAVATVDPTEMTDERPEWMGATSVRGSEGVGVDDITIPRIDIIQDLSPQHKEDKPEYIEGAKAGMIFNTVSNKLYGKTLVVIPILFRKEFVIWKDRDEGGGFRGAHSSVEKANAALEDLEDGAQCEIVDTAQHFVLIADEDNGLEEAVMSMSKSKMKISRQLNTLVRMTGGDRWSRAYRFTATGAQNAKAQDYYNYQLRQLGFVSKEFFDRAEAMYMDVKAGVKDVDRNDGSSDADTDEGKY